MLSLKDISVAFLSPKYVGKGHLRGFYVSVDLEMNEIFGVLSKVFIRIGMFIAYVNERITKRLHMFFTGLMSKNATT